MNDTPTPENSNAAATAAAGDGASPPLNPNDELAQAQRQRDEYLDQLQRSRAEFLNYRRTISSAIGGDTLRVSIFENPTPQESIDGRPAHVGGSPEGARRRGHVASLAAPRPAGVRGRGGACGMRRALGAVWPAFVWVFAMVTLVFAFNERMGRYRFKLSFNPRQLPPARSPGRKRFNVMVEAAMAGVFLLWWTGFLRFRAWLPVPPAWQTKDGVSTTLGMFAVIGLPTALPST